MYVTVNAQLPIHYNVRSKQGRQHVSSIARMSAITKGQLTLFHHANVNAAFEATGLTVAPVVLGDGAASIEWTGEGGFTLHTAPKGVQNESFVILE